MDSQEILKYMKIGIDVRILEKKMCGIGRYTEGILQGISRLERDKNQYFLFCVNGIENKRQNDNFEIISTWRNIGLPKGIFSSPPFWLNFVLPAYLKKYGIDICFFPAHFCPLIQTKTRYVIVIHDMAHKLEKRAKNWWRRAYINFSLNQSVKKASAVIAVSENSKRDILKIYPEFNPKKISVVYNAADEKFRTRDINELTSWRVNELRKKYNLPENFVLYVGKIEERKNIKGILKVADLLYQHDKKIKFILIGNKGYFGYRELKEEIEKRKNKNIIHIEYISDDDLSLAYNLARVFFYPSFYEGFGLGVLEAMQSGIPVLTSNTSSMPELVGDGGLMHKPDDYNSFLKDLIRLIRDKNFYLEMQEKSLKQAKKFNWKTSAEKLIRVFESIV